MATARLMKNRWDMPWQILRFNKFFMSLGWHRHGSATNVSQGVHLPYEWIVVLNSCIQLVGSGHVLPFNSLRILKSTCSWKRCKTILEKHRSKWCRTELGVLLVLGGWMFGRGCRLVGGWLSKKHLNRMGSCQMDPRSNSLSVTVMEAAYFR